jgi:multidrug resistance protein, MATE family
MSWLKTKLSDWRGRSRYREVLRVGLPLLLSSAAVTVMEFTDRAFLSNYSLAAISAATPAGLAALVPMVLLSGVSGFAGVFIAQYVGAGMPRRIGGVLWQAIYFSILAGLLTAALAGLAEPIFAWSGHAPEVQHLEVVYFRILSIGAGLHILGVGLSAFFTGRGVTRPVLAVNLVGMLFNVPLDYALIYGAWGFPEMGIAGAGYATVSSWGLILILYALLIFTPAHERVYGLLRALRPDVMLFRRLLRFGVPAGLQSTVDLLGFLFFLFVVGRIGTAELAATNIVININALAFMPAYGFSIGVSTLVGQALGRGTPDQARAAVWSAVHLMLVYTALVDLVYIVWPERLIGIFIPEGADQADYAAVIAVSTVLLRIVSLYVFMDALYMIFAGALRGAGDTRFVMWSLAAASLTVMVLPVYILVERLHLGIIAAWLCVLLFIAVLCAICAWRYAGGKWQHMRLLEREPPLT